MKKRRPNSVQAAIWCLLLAYGLASLLMVARLDWAHFLSYFVAIPTISLAWFTVIMIMRGENWARWFFTCMTAAWLVMLLAHFRREMSQTGVDAALLVSQLALILAAAFLLFTRSSDDWFRLHE